MTPVFTLGAGVAQISIVHLECLVKCILFSEVVQIHVQLEIKGHAHQVHFLYTLVLILL